MPSPSCGQRLQNSPGSFKKLVIIAFESSPESDKILFAALFSIPKIRLSFYRFTSLNKLNVLRFTSDVANLMEAF